MSASSFSASSPAAVSDRAFAELVGPFADAAAERPAVVEGLGAVEARIGAGAVEQGDGAGGEALGADIQVRQADVAVDHPG